MAHALTRVTLVGSRKHVDLLLPSDQPVGLLLPQVLALLDDPPAEHVSAKVLVAADGTELNTDMSLDQARVLDGSALLLCNAAEAPPAAVVYDVTDLVVHETSGIPGQWTRRSSALAAGTFTAAGIWAGAEILLTALAPDSAGWLLLGLALLGLAAGTAAGTAAGKAVGTAAGRPTRPTPLAGALLAAGWLTGLGGAVHVYGGVPERLAVASLLLAGVSVLTMAALGTISAQPRAFFSGAVTLALAVGLWVGAAAVASDVAGAAALAALAGTLMLGLLPTLALASSGLARLDDQRAKGGSIARTDALDAVAAAHRGLTLGTAVTAACVAPGLWLLGADAEHQNWTLPLLLTLTLAVFLRTRSFPLAAQRFALYLAVAVGLGAAMLGALRLFPAQPWAVGLAVLLTAAAACVSLTATFPDHVQARFRLLARRTESAAILASVPLTAGMFGVFNQLAGTFS